MWSASKPERGGECEDGKKEDAVTEESAGWVTFAFAAIAAMISGDHEKWVKIGDLMSSGHISRSLDESPNNLIPNQASLRERRENDALIIENLTRELLHLNTPVLRTLKQVEPLLEDRHRGCAR